MAENSKIEWTDHTFNPWIGCQKVSPGCDHCYAEAMMDHRYGKVEWGPHGERKRTSSANWQLPIKWNRVAAAAGKRHLVFCASLADVFDNQVPVSWRRDLWHRIEQTPALTWLLLTKRPQNIAKMLPDPETGVRPWGDGWSNVWLGTTAENQEEYNRRFCGSLMEVPARIRFISYEPALGPLQIERGYVLPDWVIAGGEGGSKARPASIQWFRELRDECAEYGIPFLFKQWGEWAPAGLHRSGEAGRFAFGDYEHDRAAMMQVDSYPREFTKFGAHSVLQRVGKKRAGRLLDGVQHDGFPR